MSNVFTANRRSTLGIEEEFQICDPDSGALLQLAEEVMNDATGPLRERMAFDLIQGLIEINTEVAEDVAEGMSLVLALRRQLQEVVESRGATLGITGTHPFADPRQTRFVGTPGYRWVADQLHYIAQRNLSFGLHVHVALDDPEEAIYVANRLRPWVGPLIALAANSPFLDGVDTGWDSARCYAFGAFPRSGLPPRLSSWEEYEEVIEKLTRATSITLPRQIWWTVRAHPTFGTVEMRACDVQASLIRTGSIVALTQALVMAYADRYRAGEPEPNMHQAYLEDGRWKGMRFGLDTEMIDAETGEVMPMRDLIRRMLDIAGDAAAALGNEKYLQAIDTVLEEGNGAQYQRRVAAELGGDLSKTQVRLLKEARQTGIWAPDQFKD